MPKELNAGWRTALKWRSVRPVADHDEAQSTRRSRTPGVQKNGQALLRSDSPDKKHISTLGRRVLTGPRILHEVRAKRDFLRRKSRSDQTVTRKFVEHNKPVDGPCPSVKLRMHRYTRRCDR